jgi:hypothetical protein
MTTPKKPKQAPAVKNTKGTLTIKPRAVISAPIVNRDPRQLLTR